MPIDPDGSSPAAETAPRFCYRPQDFSAAFPAFLGRSSCTLEALHVIVIIRDVGAFLYRFGPAVGAAGGAGGARLHGVAKGGSKTTLVTAGVVAAAGGIVKRRPASLLLKGTPEERSMDAALRLTSRRPEMWVI